ncbi:MAG: hypothetical protein ACI4J0_07335 [Huintestinicola sp.]|uniref:hypothetical protein n=1 Tax=Huintestinicola sp. TaxID=2981661 RepID=UPI003F0E65F6
MKIQYTAALLALLLMCGCSKNEGETEEESETLLSPATTASSVTTAPEEEPEIKYSAKSTYYVEHNEPQHSSEGGAANKVIPLKDGDELTFRAADGSGEAVSLEVGDEFSGWTMDSFLMFSNDNGSFQSRFSTQEREFEGTLTIHISDLTDELEAAFVPDDAASFPKASTDGRTLWFAADNLEETLEMLGYSPEETFEKETVLRVRLKTDRIYINNLPLDDVNNLIRVLSIEKI